MGLIRGGLFRGGVEDSWDIDIKQKMPKRRKRAVLSKAGNSGEKKGKVPSTSAIHIKTRGSRPKYQLN